MFMISRYASTNLLRTSVSARNDTLAFCISSITCGSSTPGTPRSNLVATSAALACVEFTLSRPCFSSLAKPLSIPATPFAPAAPTPPTPPAPPALVAWEMLRIWASTRSISIWLMALTSDSDQSRCRDIDAGAAEARQLLAQRARADAQLLGHLAAAAVRGTQRLEDHVALGALHGLVQGRHAAIGGQVQARGLLLEQDVLGFDDRAFHQHQRALQQVVELAHVAG